MDGEYTDKRRFLIFDYCGNFEYFRQHKEGYEARETKSLSENIFGKQIRLMMALQGSDFTGEDFQTWRETLVSTCHGQVVALKDELIAVKLHRQYVDKYRNRDVFICLSDEAKGELEREIASLVYNPDTDELAKRFDNFMYGLMLAQLEQLPSLRHAQRQLRDTAALLERKATIPQVKDKLPLLKEVQTDAFWEAGDLLLLERVRQELRGLMQFLDQDSKGKGPVVTRLTDPVTQCQEGMELEAAYDFQDYRAKVNRYINEHGDTMAIYKLTHNIPLSSGDYQELEHVLTCELGSREDYQREFGDTPFGLLVRKIAKLDHQAAMDAFSTFINDQSLNQKQIAFVHKVIRHVELNGYMEHVSELTRPPFDKPISFLKLFDAKTRMALVKAIDEVKENAVDIIA